MEFRLAPLLTIDVMRAGCETGKSLYTAVDHSTGETYHHKQNTSGHCTFVACSFASLARNVERAPTVGKRSETKLSVEFRHASISFLL
jgi:hypothetical protein